MSLRLLSASAVVTLLAAAPAVAAWTAPEQASKGPLPARSPHVATNARGDTASVWVRGSRRDAAVVVSLRAAGGSWGEPVAISRRGRPAIDPEVAVDASGRVVVVWRQVVRTRVVPVTGGRRHQAVYVVRTRERALGDMRWSRITTLSSDRQKVGPPELGIDDDGAAVVAWHWGTGTSPGDRGFVGQVQFAERRTDGAWSGPRRLSRSSLCAEVRLPRVAVGARGHAVVWWQCDLRSDRSTALAVTRAPDGDFGPEVELPFRTVGDVSADLAVSPDGRAVAVSVGASGTLSWWRGSVGDTLALGALPVLGAPDRVDPDAGGPAIAVNASGDALSGWIDAQGTARVAPVASDLGVGTPSSLRGSDDTAASMRVAVGDRRSGALAWIAGGRVLASTRGGDGAAADGMPISSAGVEALDPPALATDGGGDATVLWTRVVRGRAIIERATTSTP